MGALPEVYTHVPVYFIVSMDNTFLICLACLAIYLLFLTVLESLVYNAFQYNWIKQKNIYYRYFFQWGSMVVVCNSIQWYMWMSRFSWFFFFWLNRISGLEPL